VFFRLSTWELWLIVASIVLGFVAIGYLGGRVLRHQAETLREPVGIVQGAFFALVGLVLAFGLTLALGRYDSRRAAVVDAESTAERNGVDAKRALITGITGQDGSYLAEFLLEKGYTVVGMVRRASKDNFERIEHLLPRLVMKQADLLDQLSLIRALEDSRPHELYNLAAQSFVPTSWTQPVLTAEFTALGVTRLLDAVRLVDPGIRFYQASSS